jgi:microcystin-dependent protein
MATVTGLTAAETQALLDDEITTGSIDDNGHLQLGTRGGDTIDAGAVVGPVGAVGPPGPPGEAGDAPSGAVMMFAATIPPTGWLVCDGSAVSRSTYAGLWGVIGTTYGSGDGATTFNLPDFRTRVPRMDNPNIGLAGGTTPVAHDHKIDGGSADAVAHVSFVTGPSPNIHMERIPVASWTGNFAVDDPQSGDQLEVITESASHGNGAKVTGQTSTNSVSPTETDLLNPFLNVSFIIKI